MQITMDMETIRDKEFGGERPLFASHDLRLENVVIHAGESAIKECTASGLTSAFLMWEAGPPSGIRTILK